MKRHPERHRYHASGRGLVVGALCSIQQTRRTLTASPLLSDISSPSADQGGSSWEMDLKSRLCGQPVGFGVRSSNLASDQRPSGRSDSKKHVLSTYRAHQGGQGGGTLELVFVISCPGTLV